MARTTDGSARGLPPFLLFSNILIWCSAVIVMGIVSYFISQSTYSVGRLLIYTEVISVLTVAFFVASFLLGNSPGYSLLFNIIFSYLWLVAVVFTAESWSHSSAGALAHTVEAFCFIAFFFLVFNIFHDWNLGFGGARSRSAVGTRRPGPAPIHMSPLEAELLGLIFGDEALQLKDVAALARTCTFFYQIAISHLYRFNIKHERSSALFWAVENSQLRTMRRALELGADPNIVGPDPGESPEELFNAATGKISRERYISGSPLHYAAKAGDNHMVNLLLDYGAKTNVPSRHLCVCQEHQNFIHPPINPEPPRWFPLHHAVCRGHVATATILIDRGAPMQMAYEVEEVGYGPSLLHCASAHGLESLVRRALEKDPALLARRARDSPFDYCTQSWNSEGVIRCLLSAGADLDEENRGTYLTPIFHACEVGNYSTAMHLLRAGAQTAPAQPGGIAHFRRPPLLHYAVCCSDYFLDPPLSPAQRTRDEEQLAFVRALIEEFGQNVNETFSYEDDNLEASPFAVAMFGDIEMGRDRVADGHFNDIFLDCVNPDLIELLLNAGADPNHAGVFGYTPLALAVSRLVYLYDKRPEDEPVDHKRESDALKIVSMLLRFGARLDKANEFGDTPLDLAAYIRARIGHDTKLGQLFDFLLENSSSKNMSHGYLKRVMRRMIGELERKIARQE
ncbi:hypothetical protein DL768_011426 [Monosporascus sp. mg162]|nr:hypothetical protein DL768_011426 [Monosporascus sp. mg162]